jgi:hypothetical protein
MPTTQLWCVAKGCPGNRTRFASRPPKGPEPDPSCPTTQEPTPTNNDNPIRPGASDTGSGFNASQDHSPTVNNAKTLPNPPLTTQTRSGMPIQSGDASVGSGDRLYDARDECHGSGPFPRLPMPR